MSIEKLFSIPIANISEEEALENVKKLVLNGSFNYVVTVNSLMLIRSFFDKEFKNILKNSSMNIVDSVGIEIGLFLKGIKLKQRIPGVDFARKIMNWAEEEGKTIYLLGGSYETVVNAERNIKSTFTSLF